MIRRPPRSTRTDTLFPYTTLFRSQHRTTRRAGNHLEPGLDVDDADAGNQIAVELSVQHHCVDAGPEIEREAAATVHLVGAHGQPVADQAVVLEETRPFDTQVTQCVFGLNTNAGHAARGEGDRGRLAIADEGRSAAQPRLLESVVVLCDKG